MPDSEITVELSISMLGRDKKDKIMRRMRTPAERHQARVGRETPPQIKFSLHTFKIFRLHHFHSRNRGNLNYLYSRESDKQIPKPCP